MSILKTTVEQLAQEDGTVFTILGSIQSGEAGVEQAIAKLLTLLVKEKQQMAQNEALALRWVEELKEGME
jgi:hypothetical protein